MQKKQESNDLSNDDYNQSHVVSLFALVGMSITIIMGFIGLYNNDITLAGVLFLAGFIYFIGYYNYKKSKNIKLISATTLYTLYSLMFYLVFTGGVEQTGPLWIYIAAPVSVFIHGLKRGLLDIALFIIIISLIMFIPTDIIAHVTYSTAFKLRLLYSFLTITFLSALYEYTREQSYKDTLELSIKYQQLANIDPLTQLSNRRHALDILMYEQAKLVRNKEPLSVVLCDIDHFKEINDKYGHNAGDAALKELARVFSESIRKQDCVARWGGEEFLFILPQTAAENAYVIAEKIREKLENLLIIHEGNEIKVTLSMGIEQLDGDQNIDEVINHADKYLYQAKAAGRNKVFPQCPKTRMVS